jgi:hypothetical protein
MRFCHRVHVIWFNEQLFMPALEACIKMLKSTHITNAADALAY